MKTEEVAKIQDVIELIRLAVMQPEQIEPMLASIVQQSVNTSKNDMDVEKVVAGAKERLYSDAYLKRFAQSFDKIFTHDEIKLLISFYRAEAVKKLFKTGTETFSPIFAAMQEIVTDIVKPSLSKDNVIAIIASNFEREVKECKGSVLLEVYSMMCGPCQDVAPIFSDLSTELGDKIKFCKLDLGSEFQLSKTRDIFSADDTIFQRRKNYRSPCRLN